MNKKEQEKLIDKIYFNNEQLDSEVANSWNENHFCFVHRERFQNEGDDCIHEHCTFCGRIRYEGDGKRPFAWFNTNRNLTFMQYAWADPAQGDSVWKF